ncbi:hypothetical protein [Sporosarcina sp. FSL W7-1283]|uniref:hypothetical protein n=1 Tax=Sporosarcina sp. FSL W7-1283 TaxID=2921560 RepID=UPI0030FC7377
MESTNKLHLKIVTENSFEEDDIEQTIIEYGKNFGKLEYESADSGSNIEDLKAGHEYMLGKKVWNSHPISGGHIGWVNLRKGIYAPEWKPLKNFMENDIIRAFPDNGNIYKCITAGKTMARTPSFLTNASVEFYDANGNKWIPNYNYEVNDVVFSLDNSVVFYYICETAGFSATEEPDWNKVANGTTVIDGSVTWRKERTVKWKQVGTSSNFKPFGKIE